MCGRAGVVKFVNFLWEFSSERDKRVEESSLKKRGMKAVVFSAIHGLYVV